MVNRTSSVVCFPGLGKTTYAKQHREEVVDTDYLYKAVSMEHQWFNDIPTEHKQEFYSLLDSVLEFRCRRLKMKVPVIVSNLHLPINFNPKVVVVPADVSAHAARLTEIDRSDLSVHAESFEKWKANYVSYANRLSIPRLEIGTDEFLTDVIGVPSQFIKSI